MGKPKQDIEKKQTFKSPISPFWLGTYLLSTAPVVDT